MEPGWWGPAPGLVARPQGEPRGTVLLLHGLHADALANAAELASLAERGFCAVGLDAVGHGRRHDPDREARYADDLWGALAEDVWRIADELPEVVDAVLAAHPGPIGLVGISFGAFATWAALCTEPRVQVACPILGSPELPGHPRSPHHQLPAAHPRPVLAHSAGRDESVPLAPTVRLVEVLSASWSTPVELEVLPESPHAVPEPDWHRLWSRTLGFLETHLG